MGKRKHAVMIGSGQYGKVFAIPKSKNCIKVFEGINNAFLVELGIMRSINHPNITCVTGLVFPDGTSNEELGIMYVREDTDLFELILHQKLSNDTIQVIVAGLLDALVFLKLYNILHCDIKPTNILVSGQHVRLCDFGMAQLVRPGRYAYPAYTDGYRAEEVLMEIRELCGPPAEIYALGVCMANMCTQTFAHTDRGVSQICLENVDAEMEVVINSMLHPDPKLRPDAATVRVNPLFKAHSGGDKGTASVPEYSATNGKFMCYYGGIVLEAWKLYKEAGYQAISPYFVACQIFRFHLGTMAELPACLRFDFSVCLAIAETYAFTNLFTAGYVNYTSQKKKFTSRAFEIIAAQCKWYTQLTCYDLLNASGKPDWVELLVWANAYMSSSTNESSPENVARFVKNIIAKNKEKMRYSGFKQFIDSYVEHPQFARQPRAKVYKMIAASVTGS